MEVVEASASTTTVESGMGKGPPGALGARAG